MHSVHSNFHQATKQHPIQQHHFTLDSRVLSGIFHKQTFLIWGQAQHHELWRTCWNFQSRKYDTNFIATPIWAVGQSLWENALDELGSVYSFWVANLTHDWFGFVISCIIAHLSILELRVCPHIFSSSIVCKLTQCIDMGSRLFMHVCRDVDVIVGSCLKHDVSLCNCK